MAKNWRKAHDELLTQQMKLAEENFFQRQEITRLRANLVELQARNTELEYLIGLQAERRFTAALDEVRVGKEVSGGVRKIETE
jgi:hypothetical protein